MTGLGTGIVRASGAADFRIVEIDGVEDYGELTLDAVTLRGSKAASGNVGGGIANFGGTVTLNGSTLRDNSSQTGGGLYDEAGTSTLFGGAVVGNTALAPNGGGGIYESSGSVSLVGALVRSNSPNNCAPTASVPFRTG